MEGRIKLEPNLTDGQLVKLYLHYKEEQEREKQILKNKYPQLFQGIKNFFFTYKNDIFHNPKNAHLRREK